MQQSQIIFSFLVPANKNGPIAVQPTVSVFYYPASGFVAFTLLFGFSFLFSTKNVGSTMPLLAIIMNYFAVIAFVQAQVLGVIFLTFGLSTTML